MSKLVKVADVSELQPGQCKVVSAGNRQLALCNVGGKFYALDNACPHRGGPLGEGILEGHILSCPWHGWRFDVSTGASPVVPTAKVDTFRVVVEGNEVKVEV